MPTTKLLHPQLVTTLHSVIVDNLLIFTAVCTNQQGNGETPAASFFLLPRYGEARFKYPYKEGTELFYCPNVTQSVEPTSVLYLNVYAI